jgi:NADH-quinone oxidoreductase subunit N
MTAPDINVLSLMPVLTVLLTAVLATVLPFYTTRRGIAGLSAVGLTVALLWCIPLWNRGLSSFSGSFVADNFALGFSVVLILAGLLAITSSLDAAKREGMAQGEFYAILLYAITGTMLLVHARDLITLLIGFEIMSLGVYVLSSFQERRTSEEAGMKYFLLGSFASAILIFGIALVFGATGSFSLEAIRASLASGPQNPQLLAVGALMVLIGFGFKVAFAPFHQWTPDVYSGAPMAVTQYMSVGIKAAAFAGMLKIFTEALPNSSAWQTPAQFLIALTLMIGNLAALRQDNLKRLLAYSSVAHAGYIGLTVLATPQNAYPAALYYLFIYTLMNAGAFAVLNAISPSEDGVRVESLTGLGSKSPFLATMLTFFLVSLAGLPPLAGFMGKYLVFSAAAQAGYYGLVILAAVTSAISLYYYLRPVALMWFSKRGVVSELPNLSSPYSRVAMLICAAGVVVFGLLPGIVTGLIQNVGQIASR